MASRCYKYNIYWVRLIQADRSHSLSPVCSKSPSKQNIVPTPNRELTRVLLKSLHSNPRLEKTGVWYYGTSMVKMTFTFDENTCDVLRRTATRLKKPQSVVVREAIQD